MRQLSCIYGVLIGCLLLPCTVFAAGNYLPGVGARSTGKAGAVVATGDDGDSVFHNPANLSRMRGFGLRFDNTLSIQDLSFQRDPAGALKFDKVDKANNPVYIPMLSIWYSLKNIGPGTLNFTAFAYGPHGASGYNYPSKEGECKKAAKGAAQICNPMPEPGPQRLNRISASNTLILSGLAAAYEWQIKDSWALRLGGTFKFAYLLASQKQAAIAAGALYVPGPLISGGEVVMDLSGQGFSFTGDVGLSVSTPGGFSAGLSVLLPMSIELDGKLVVQMNRTFGNLAQLEGDTIQAIIDFPLVLRAGIGWSYRNRFTFEAAFVLEKWGNVGDQKVKPQNMAIVLGSQRNQLPEFSIPQNLRDSYSVRVGMEYNLKDWVYFRLGWLMETGATRNEQLSTSTMDYPKHAITGGLSFNIPGGLSVDFSILHAFYQEFTVSNSESKPIDVSPDTLKSPKAPASVSNGKYVFGVTAISFAIRGNWLK